MLYFMQFVAVPGFVLPKALWCFFLYYTTDLGPDAFELPFPTWYDLFFLIVQFGAFFILSCGSHRFPFDCEVPRGYAVAILFQIKMAAIPIRLIGCFASLGFACFLFSMSVSDDMKNDIRSINQNVRKKRLRSNICVQFNEFIRFMKLKRFAQSS